MKKTLIILSLLASMAVGLMPISAEVINLSPLAGVAAGDGPDQPITLFRRGPQFVALRVPPNWKAVGGSSEVTFTRAGGNQVTAVWRVYTGKLKFDGDAKSSASFQKLALATAPAGSKDVAPILDPTPGKIYGMNTLEAQISFNAYGNSFRRSVMVFEDTDKQQYSFVITSLASDFDNTYKDAMGFLKSWWNVTEKELGEVRLVR